MPGNIYPGMLLAELIRDVRGRPAATPSTKLLERVREAAPREWAAFEDSVLSLECGPRSSWPHAGIAAQTLAALDALRTPWTQIEAETRIEYRKDGWYRKDPAHRRALGWLQLCTWVLSGLASSSNGPLRLFVDYLFGLLRYFEQRSREPVTVCPNKAVCDVLVLEVFEVAYNYAELADIDVEPRLTRGSHGHDGSRVRKRVQRARLNSVLRRHAGAKLLVSDQLWSEWLRPQLELLAARP